MESIAWIVGGFIYCYAFYVFDKKTRKAAPHERLQAKYRPITSQNQ